MHIYLYGWASSGAFSLGICWCLKSVLGLVCQQGVCVHVCVHVCLCAFLCALLCLLLYVRGYVDFPVPLILPAPPPFTFISRFLCSKASYPSLSSAAPQFRSLPLVQSMSPYLHSFPTPHPFFPLLSPEDQGSFSEISIPKSLSSWSGEGAVIWKPRAQKAIGLVIPQSGSCLHRL